MKAVRQYYDQHQHTTMASTTADRLLASKLPFKRVFIPFERHTEAYQEAACQGLRIVLLTCFMSEQEYEHRIEMLHREIEGAVSILEAKVRDRTWNSDFAKESYQARCEMQKKKHAWEEECTSLRCLMRAAKGIK